MYNTLTECVTETLPRSQALVIKVNSYVVHEVDFKSNRLF